MTTPESLAAELRADAERWRMLLLVDADHLRTRENRLHSAAYDAYNEAFGNGFDRVACVDAARATLAARPAVPAVHGGWTDADADAARLALELECLLTDPHTPTPVASRWWDSAHEALSLHRQRLAAAPATPSPAPAVGRDARQAALTHARELVAAVPDIELEPHHFVRGAKSEPYVSVAYVQDRLSRFRAAILRALEGE